MIRTRSCCSQTGASASSASYKLVRCVLEFLKTRGLQPVLCQRVVAMPARGVATAVDLLCFDAAEHALWVLELKTVGFIVFKPVSYPPTAGACLYSRVVVLLCLQGYAGDRAMACRADGRQCHLAHPLSKAADTHLNRHILQAVLGREMLVLETGFAEQLMQKFGVSDVRAAVLYVNGATVDLVVPDAWWTRKASEALQRLADG